MLSFLSFSGSKDDRLMRTSVCFVSQVFCVYSECLWSNSAEVCRSCELTAGDREIHEHFGFYTAAQNNHPPIGWENRSRWITPSQLDRDTSWPVKSCFLLIDGAGERERVPRCCCTNTSVDMKALFLIFYVPGIFEGHFLFVLFVKSSVTMLILVLVMWWNLWN